MATQPLVRGVTLAIRGSTLRVATRGPARRTLQLSAARFKPNLATALPSQPTPLASQVPSQIDVFAENQYAAFLGEADSNDGHDTNRETHGPPEASLDAGNAAYLGEADSNDGFEVRRHAEGDMHESMDGQNAAFLGEADSDDGFEARRAAEGDGHESLDARNAAFLGEADSDDAHEADFDINPEKYRHKIEDAGSSGLHGQHGEHDQ